MAPITVSESAAVLEPWQEFESDPDPGERGVDQAGRAYIWHPTCGWQLEPEMEPEAG